MQVDTDTLSPFGILPQLVVDGCGKMFFLLKYQLQLRGDAGQNEYDCSHTYSYFTMTFNNNHDPERRQKVYDRAIRALDRFADDENLHVAVQYTAIMDDGKIRRDAKLAAPKLAGRACAYNGMVGRIEQGSECLYFRKKRSRKHIYKLADTDILALSWILLT